MVDSKKNYKFDLGVKGLKIYILTGVSLLLSSKAFSDNFSSIPFRALRHQTVDKNN